MSSCCWCWVMLFHGLAWVCFVPTAFSVWSMSYHFSSVPCEHCVQLCDFPPHNLPCCASSSQPVPVLPHCACVALALSMPACKQVFQSVHWPHSIECAHIPDHLGSKVPIVAPWLQYQILELKPFLSYKTQFKCSFLHVLSEFIHCLTYEP